MKGDFGASIDYYTSAIRLKPDLADAYFNRGVSKGNLNMHEQAIRDYDKAIELKKDNADAFYSRGVSKINLHHYQEACKDLKTAIDLGNKPANELVKSFCQ
jgi:tetratricopeptide (TPR) repeat protein